MYIRALRATLNKTDQLFNSMSLYQSASYMSFVIPAWLKEYRCNAPIAASAEIEGGSGRVILKV